jgi:two-component system sensor histidine kinase VicK
VRRDGGRFAAEIMTSSFEVAGTRKWITIVRDITERKRMDQLKNDFVSTVSHELRTPLTSIRGALGLLAGGVAGPLPEQAMKLVQISHSGSERLSRLINDLLDMQKLEAGKMDFNFAAHPLAVLLQDAVSAIQSYASQYQVEVRLPAVLPDLMLWVDADRMQQVLNNLLSNACKFSPAQGVVDVVLSTEKNPENAENRVRIAIVDHGPGIKEDFKLRMFQKFSQSDSSDTKAKGGTGLGLSIAKVIVEQMGGTLSYVSEAPCGATFFIDLPSHQAAAG